MTLQQVLIGGQWRASAGGRQFRAENPATQTLLDESYPISSWSDCDAALDSAYQAFQALRRLPAAILAEFLDAFASQIERSAERLVAIAVAETALPAAPR